MVIQLCQKQNENGFHVYIVKNKGKKGLTRCFHCRKFRLSTSRINIIIPFILELVYILYYSIILTHQCLWQWWRSRQRRLDLVTRRRRFLCPRPGRHRISCRVFYLPDSRRRFLPIFGASLDTRTICYIHRYMHARVCVFRYVRTTTRGERNTYTCRKRERVNKYGRRKRNKMRRRRKLHYTRVTYLSCKTRPAWCVEFSRS